MNVIKRDGQIVEFDKTKIANAIKKASENSLVTNERITDDSLDVIIKNIDSKLIKMKKDIDVETIQDLVIKELNSSGYKQLAREYSEYRKDRTIERNRRSSLMKELIEKIEAKKVKNQNANVDEYSYGGRKGEADSVMMKDIALNNMMPKWMANAHNNNEVYIHDLDSYATGMSNCDTVPFDQLLKYGFKVRQTDIRPANSINTALQLVMILFQIQSLQQYGGCSASHLDWTLVPYFRKSFYKNYQKVCNIIPLTSGKWLSKIKDPEKESIDSKIYRGSKFNIFKHYASRKALALTIKETDQAVEGMYHNANSLTSRSGNQLNVMAA